MIRAAVRRPRGLLLPQGAGPAGCTPHFLFPLVEKKTGRARSKRKDRLDALRRVRASARRGSADRCKRRFWPAFGHAFPFCKFVTAVPWRMVRRSSGWSSHGAASLFAAAGLAVDGSWCKPPRPPGQRVAKRNARKENLVKCVLAPRFLSEPRRGSQCSSLHRTPPRPSGSPRKPAGTISRRPPYSNFARMCKVATKSDFFSSTGRGAFSFCQEQKENGGRIPRGNGPLAGARFPVPWDAPSTNDR